MNDGSRNVIGAFGVVAPINVVHVCRPCVCAGCGRPITLYGLAIGEPYHCMLHQQCAPHFDFESGWPHPDAAGTYRAVESRNSARSNHSARSNSEQYDVYSTSPKRA